MNFSYAFASLLPVVYTVRLHFAEYRYGANGYGGVPARLFNVSINGQAALSNFNVYAAAGAQYKAVVENFSAMPDSSGKITIAFAGGTDNAEIKAIEILGQQVQINVNSTAITTDDLVRLHSQYPNREFFTPCSIQAVGNPSNDVTVSLSSPNGAGVLGFTTDPTNNPVSSSITLTLAKDGTSQTFYITGEGKSSALGDAVIQAADPVSSNIDGTSPATVFWFNNPVTNNNTVGGKMAITADGAYQSYLTTTQGQSAYLIAADSYAIDAVAQTMLMPSGISTAAPQVMPLQLGIEQNGSMRKNVYTYGSPVIQWYTNYNNDPNMPPITNGTTTVSVNALKMQTDSSLASTCNDAASSMDEPFYVRTAKGTNNTGLVGLTNQSTITDNPDSTVPEYSIPMPIKDTNGYTDGLIAYQFQKAAITVSFQDWCTVADSNTAVAGQTQWLSEGAWGINITQDNNNSYSQQKATAGVQNKVPPPDTPVETGTICNDASGMSTGLVDSGSAKVTWTYPSTTPNP